MTSSARLFDGGVHPHDGKSLSCSKVIQTAPLLDKYTVLLQQHIGAPPRLLVKNKQLVKKGEIIAKAGGFVSAPVHSPTSGAVKLINSISPTGTVLSAVAIESDGEDKWHESIENHEPVDWTSLDSDALIKKISDSGIVGMGGAAFPTSVKLSPPRDKVIDTLILNGVECEPFLTADHRLMLEDAEKIIEGVKILAKILNISKVIIGIEDNKPDAINTLSEILPENITVVSLRVMYPQGAEKQLIYAATSREVPCGGLPMDIGCVVQNVATAAATFDAVVNGIPLIERVTTVTGTPVVEPGNWRVRIGTPLSKVLEFVKGVNEQPAKILFGGPMMGQAVYSLDIPIMKNTSGVLLLKSSEIAQYQSNACIRCGRCVDACPMKLMPGTLSVMIESEKFDLAEYTNVMDCMECGCCAYACPALRPLVQHMRRGKSEVIANKNKK